MKKIIFLLALVIGLSAINLPAQTNDNANDRPSRKEQREKKRTEKRMEKRARQDKQAPARERPQMQQAPNQAACPIYGWPMGQGRRGGFGPNAQGIRPQGRGPGFAQPQGGNLAPSFCPNCGRPLGGAGRQAWMGRGQGFGRGGMQAYGPRFNMPQNDRKPMGRGPAMAPQPNNPQPQAPAQNFNGPMRRGRGGPGAGAPFNRPGPRFQSQDSNTNAMNQ